MVFEGARLSRPPHLQALEAETSQEARGLSTLHPITEAPLPPEAPFPAPLSLHSLPSYYSLTSAPAWSCAAETNHIIVDMRFNQVIRAEPRAGEYGPGVPEYQAGLGSRPQQIEKSFTAQLGAASPVVAGPSHPFAPSVRGAQL